MPNKVIFSRVQKVKDIKDKGIRLLIIQEDSQKKS